MLHEFEHNNYGLKDGIIPAFADALGPEGLNALTQLIRGKLNSPTRGSTNDGPDRSRYEATYSRIDPDRRCQR